MCLSVYARVRACVRGARETILGAETISSLALPAIAFLNRVPGTVQELSTNLTELRTR